MGNQGLGPQEQQPKRTSGIWIHGSTSFIVLLALLWRLIVWMWSILIIGIAVGVLGNALFTLLTTGKIDLTGTLIVIAWLSAHFSLCITILTLTLVITLCSYLAHYGRQRVIRENQHAHDEALVVVAKGVQRTLDELNAKPPALHPSLSVVVDEDSTPRKVIWNIPYRRNPFFTGREKLLKQLHDNLAETKAAALTQAQAISGLGGIVRHEAARVIVSGNNGVRTKPAVPPAVSLNGEAGRQQPVRSPLTTTLNRKVGSQTAREDCYLLASKRIGG